MGELEIRAEYNHAMGEIEGLPHEAPDDLDDLFAMRDNLRIVIARPAEVWRLMTEERPEAMRL